MTKYSRIFIDTNVLIYLNNEKHLFHKNVLHTLDSLKAEGANLIISDQIIKEFLVVKSNLLKIEKKYNTSILKADYDFVVNAFTALKSPENILTRLLGLIVKYELKGKVIHDAFAAAFCLESGIYKIFTLNTKDFAQFVNEGLEIVQLRKSTADE